MAKLEVTDKVRSQVEAMKGLGLTVEEIAIVLDTSVRTIYRRFKKELAKGEPKANSKVAEALYKKAIGNGPQSVAAAIFWLKTRARWTTVEHVHVHGMPQHDGPPRLADLRNLSTEDLRALDDIARRLEAARKPVDGEEDREGGSSFGPESRSNGLPSRN